jgi:phospholipase/carboxylesterase
MNSHPTLHDYKFAEDSGEAGRPLVFAFHGTGGDEHQLRGLAADLVPGATIIAPRGDVSEHGAARFFRRTGEGIYDMADLAARTTRMARFIRAHRARVGAPATLGIGYSNGANILASVLFAHPELFDAAVLMHPLIPFTPPPQPGLGDRRVLITAGRRDPIAPVALTEALARYLDAQGAVTLLDWHEGGHDLRAAEIAAATAFLARPAGASG